MSQSAEQIKKAIIEKKILQGKAVEEAEILGVKGYLFKISSFDMEGFRQLANDPDPQKSRLGPAKLVQISFRDESGAMVFEELDVTLIAGIDEDQIGPVYRRCLQINGYGIEGGELLLKNLLKTLGADGLYGLLASMGAPCPVCSKSTAPASSANNGSSSGTGRPVEPPTTGEPS